MKKLMHFCGLAWKVCPSYILLLAVQALAAAGKLWLNVILPKFLVEELVGNKELRILCLFGGLIVLNNVGMAWLEKLLQRLLEVRRRYVRGLYCSLALNALDEGNPQEYLAILRKGLKACPGEKDMVQFLLDRFMEDACPKANPELLALAERVRAILAAYDPNDPAVAAIRESAAYKQVAWLIEPEPAGQMVQ